MKKICVNQNVELLRRFVFELGQQAIECVIQNEFPGAAGEVVRAVAWPELWVVRDEDALRALQFIENHPYSPSS